jgi:hypothetical protein
VADNYLLVEGKDDLFVISNLLESHQVPETFKIIDKEGYTNILDSLDVELDRSGLKRLGIIIDADNDVGSRWQSISDILSNLGYLSIPSVPDQNGTIILQEKRPKVGIWLMPDNQLPGMLEDFVSFLVPDKTNDPLWLLAEKSLQEATVISPQIPQAKGHIHTWLAWQKEPGTPLGLAITKRYLDANAQHAQKLIDWLRVLFEI